MIIEILLIIIGFVFLIRGADILVDGSSQIAKKLHISEIIIGLTIVSIGTSMPELFVSTTSALEGYPDLSIGNIIGSNICNLLFNMEIPLEIKTGENIQEKYINLFINDIFENGVNGKRDASELFAKEFAFQHKSDENRNISPAIRFFKLIFCKHIGSVIIFSFRKGYLLKFLIMMISTI